jgi:hypothetical protein
MAPMRAPRLALALGCLLAVGAAAVGCGGDSASDGGGTTAAEDATSRPAPPKTDFPATKGRSLGALLELADAPSELVISPAAMVFYPGGNRYPFGVFERAGAEVSDAEVALYFARVPTPSKHGKSKLGSKGPVAQAQVQALEEPAIGPFPAKIEAIQAAPAFRRATAGAPDPSTVVYSSQLDFPSEGQWRIAALIKEGDRLAAALLTSAAVGEFQRVPGPGRRAPSLPSSSQNGTDYAQALGKRPIVLLFAAPKFCQSRVCGPVVDVAGQAKREYGDEAAFIHMQIYNENDPGKGVRPEVRAFHLPSQPWLFTIDREGDVDSAIEGAFGPELLTEAVERVIAE